MVPRFFLFFFLLPFSVTGLAQDYQPPPLFSSEEKAVIQELEKPLQAKPVPDPPKPKGVVTGPKTMPSVPARPVDTEILFESGRSLTSLKDLQKPATATPAPVLVPARKPKTLTADILKEKQTAKQTAEDHKPDIEKIAAIPPMKKLESGQFTSTLYFVSKSHILSEANQNILNYSVIPLLQAHQDKNLLIQAYASPQDGHRLGDKRLSLRRAISILNRGGLMPGAVISVPAGHRRMFSRRIMWPCWLIKKTSCLGIRFLALVSLLL